MMEMKKQREKAPLKLRWSIIETSFAPALVALSERGVCCLAFNEGEAELRARYPDALLTEEQTSSDPIFSQIAQAIEDPQGADQASIALDMRGTDFQQQVWQALLEIPAGETRSYGDLAAKIGNPKASRAVGSANGANRIAALIPCHRVIAADGGLGGYAYGTQIKRALLQREAV